MDDKTKIIMQANRLLGEFTGTLEAVCMWDIPQELKRKLQKKITELKNTEIGPADHGNDIPYKIPDPVKIMVRKNNFWCHCIIYQPPKEYYHFKVCPWCFKRTEDRNKP